MNLEYVKERVGTWGEIKLRYLIKNNYNFEENFRDEESFIQYLLEMQKIIAVERGESILINKKRDEEKGTLHKYDNYYRGIANKYIFDNFIKKDYSGEERKIGEC